MGECRGQTPFLIAFLMFSGKFDGKQKKQKTKN